MDASKVDLEKFNRKNDFNIWKVRMEALLITLGLSKAIEPTTKKKGNEGSSSKSPELAVKINKKARSTVILSLSDSVIREVAKERTVAELWAKLKNLYMTKSLANSLYIKKRMFSLKMVEGSSFEEHIDEFNKVCGTLETIDESLNDECKALLLISSLPQSYSNYALMYGKKTLSLDEVKAALNTTCLQEKQVNVQSGEGLTVRGRNDINDGKKKKQRKGKNKNKSLKCFQCHKEGHFKKDCLEKKQKKKEQNGDPAIVEDKGYESTGVCVATDKVQKGKWILDFVCTFHMSPVKSYFSDYHEYDRGRVMMGNNVVCKVIGMGNIHLKLHDGTVMLIRQVRHVPDLNRNLISLKMLDQIGCSIKLECGELRILNGSTLIMKGTRKNLVYVLDGEVVTGESSVSVKANTDNTKLWHLRLEHISLKDLKELEKQKVLGADKIEKLDFYEDCVLGKSTRASFNKSVNKTKSILDYVHSDLWGPSQVSSLGRKRFFMSIIDDYSRKVWVYVLRTKDQVFGRFKEWKVLVEN